MKNVLFLFFLCYGSYAQAADGTTEVDKVIYGVLKWVNGAAITGNNFDSDAAPMSKLVLLDTVYIETNYDGVISLNACPVVETGGYFLGARGGLRMIPFQGTAIDSLYFPRTLNKIGTDACSHSTFKYVYIPPACREIGDGAFSYSSIDSLAMSNPHTAILQKAFYECKLGMGCIDLPGATIGNEAFRHSNVKKLIFHNNAVIKEYAFADNDSLRAVTFEDAPDIELSENGIFANCTGLPCIELPSKCSQLGTSAFEGCSSLERVVIPETMQTIGEKAFAGCNRLKSITVKAEIPPVLADMNVFSDYRTPTLIVPKGCRKYYERFPLWMFFDNIAEEGDPSLLEPDDSFVTPTVIGDVQVSVAYETDADGTESPVKVRAEGRCISVSHCRSGETVSLFRADGSVSAVSEPDADGNVKFTVSSPGIYIVGTSGKSVKLRIRHCPTEAVYPLLHYAYPKENL